MMGQWERYDSPMRGRPDEGKWWIRGRRRGDDQPSWFDRHPLAPVAITVGLVVGFAVVAAWWTHGVLW